MGSRQRACRVGPSGQTGTLCVCSTHGERRPAGESGWCLGEATCHPFRPKEPVRSHRFVRVIGNAGVGSAAGQRAEQIQLAHLRHRSVRQVMQPCPDMSNGCPPPAVKQSVHGENVPTPSDRYTIGGERIRGRAIPPDPARAELQFDGTNQFHRVAVESTRRRGTRGETASPTPTPAARATPMSARGDTPLACNHSTGSDDIAAESRSDWSLCISYGPHQVQSPSSVPQFSHGCCTR